MSSRASSLSKFLGVAVIAGAVPVMTACDSHSRILGPRGSLHAAYSGPSGAHVGDVSAGLVVWDPSNVGLATAEAAAVDGLQLAAGDSAVFTERWNLHDEHGQLLAPGAYQVRAQVLRDDASPLV